VGILSPGQKQILDRVLAHAERLVGVVNDLIEIVEIDTGSAVNLRVVPVDPLNVLMETLPKLEPRKASKSVTIEPVVTSPVPAILADEKGLGRIFYHLIDNAVKFSNENGKVRIKFSVEERELAIHIVDQGIGIAPDRLRMIFEAFYQVDAKLARVYEGMGIGLTLTKKLVDGTGGRILAQSEFGQGSTFTLIYPKA
jgi:signal transduction histidine kinase